MRSARCETDLESVRSPEKVIAPHLTHDYGKGRHRGAADDNDDDLVTCAGCSFVLICEIDLKSKNLV